jgi:hypothetical protein
MASKKIYFLYEKFFFKLIHFFNKFNNISLIIFETKKIKKNFLLFILRIFSNLTITKLKLCIELLISNRCLALTVAFAHFHFFLMCSF